MAQYVPDSTTGYEADSDNVIQNLRGNGIVLSTDCAVTAQSVPNMTVQVAAGTIQYDGTTVTVSSVASLVIAAADGSNARIDLVTVDSAGTVAAVTGTPSATPKPPSLPTSRILLCLISVGAGAGSVQNSNISNRRLQSDFWTNPVYKKGADIASAGSLVLGGDGNFFHVTGTTTVTSISTKPAGWLVILKFDGALTITHNASSLIMRGGTSPLTVAGDVYVFASEGSGNWREVWRNISNASATQVDLFTSTNTWTKPVGAKFVRVILFGAGGGGAGGRGSAAGAERDGGSGGGGGAYVVRDFDPSALGATETVTIGAVGASGAGGSSADGVDGGVGGDTSFGAHLKAYGGGGGRKGTAASGSGGGGGGGSGSAGGVSSGTATGNGGFPAQANPTTITNRSAGSGAFGGSPGVVNAGASEYGGGGGSHSAAGTAGGGGGDALFGGPGGGSGGGLSAANAESIGGGGGGVQTYAIGTAGGGGAANGGAGGNGTSFSGTGKPGSAGGGGGSQDSGTGGVGGNGGTPAAGGGGGGAGTSVGGAGGTGGKGEAIVITSF